MSTGTLMMAWLWLAASAAPIDIYPINQRSFQIPIRIDASRRSEIKQLILYNSTDQGQTWQQVAVSSPDKEAFQFLAPMDGLYWFSVCVVDQQGNRDPADVSKAPPAQKILVDTLKPVLRIVSAERQGDDVMVAWEIQEEHPDLATLKLEYRTPDAPANQWSTATVNQASSGQTRFRVNNPSTVLVRMQVQDQAGNLATASGEVARPGGSFAPAPMDTQPVGVTGVSAGTLSKSASAFAQAGSAWEAGQGGHGTASSGTEQASLSVQAGGGSRLVASSDKALWPGSTAGGSAKPGRAAPGSLPAVQIINSTQVPIDYEVLKQGPSGIGKVELWMTQDDGQSWRRFAEDPDLKPPITVDLPGEGVYGFTIVVLSRAGLGKHPPAPGDAPEMRVEVDTTPPTAELFAPEPDPHRRDNLVISWRVTDRNLEANPITLQWAERRDGNWELIANDLPNSGHYSWQLPSNLPIRVFLRLTARDTAGNVSEAITPEPVLVDLSEPEVVIKGIAGAAKHP